MSYWSGIRGVNRTRPTFPGVLELLREPQLAGARLLTSCAVAKACQVMRVSVQEVPFGEFVRPHEFVMTTGIGLGTKDDRFLNVVQQVANADAAALAVAVGEHVREIPRHVVGAAEELGLPLLELPWNLRFSDVTEMIIVGIASDRWSARRKIEEAYLRAIVGYERSRGLPLIETLLAWYDANGNVSAAARQLRINRHSLLYRLDRVSSLAGVDLGDASNRFALELAVRTFTAGKLASIDTSLDFEGRESELRTT